jgi:hypothetical protein
MTEIEEYTPEENVAVSLIKAVEAEGKKRKKPKKKLFIGVGVLGNIALLFSIIYFFSSWIFNKALILFLSARFFVKADKLGYVGIKSVAETYPFTLFGQMERIFDNNFYLTGKSLGILSSLFIVFTFVFALGLEVLIFKIIKKLRSVKNGIRS